VLPPKGARPWRVAVEPSTGQAFEFRGRELSESRSSAAREGSDAVVDIILLISRTRDLVFPETPVGRSIIPYLADERPFVKWEMDYRIVMACLLARERADEGFPGDSYPRHEKVERGC
jgi:hypothetical protein